MEIKPLEACCEPLLAGALMESEATELAAAFKVLAAPARLRLFSMVASIPAGRWAYFRVVPERLAVLRDALDPRR